MPTGRTARRLEWQHLPPQIRDLISERCGSLVVAAESQGGGFTPGFASVLTCADGGRHFVKAASVTAQRPFAESYREEARNLRALPHEAPAARLLWSHEQDWVVVGLEYVEGQAPARPWRIDQLTRVLDALEALAADLTPAPQDLALDTFAAETAAWPGAWDHVRRTRGDLPHLEEAAELAAAAAVATAGETLVHTDIRDDNLLLEPDGRVRICDWNWPVLGAPWLDTVFALIQPRGDGVDVERLLAERALTRDVPPAHIDRVLALLTGYFLRQQDEPVPPASPYLRQHQAWCGAVTWSWLSERRGWD